MDIKKIEELISSYWNGSNTIDEEKKIHSFFSTNKNLPQELEQWRDWFSGKDAVSNLKLDDDFDKKILSYAEQSLPKKKRIGLKYIIWSSAASVAIVLITLFRPTHDRKEVAQKEYETIKELLYFTSSKINQVEAILDENIKKIDIMNEYINIK